MSSYSWPACCAGVVSVYRLSGIEVSIDALLSPTHLLLLIGALLILSGPIRAYLRRRWTARVLRPLLPVVLAATMAAAQLGFFFQHLDGTSVRVNGADALHPVCGDRRLRRGGGGRICTRSPRSPGWGPAPADAQMDIALRRRAGPICFGLLMELLEGFDYRQEPFALRAAGLAVDLLVLTLRLGAHRPASLRILAFAVPVVMWIVHFGMFSVFAELNWPVSVWTGTIFFAGLAGVGLSLLAFPFARRPST